MSASAPINYGDCRYGADGALACTGGSSHAQHAPPARTVPPTSYTSCALNTIEVPKSVGQNQSMCGAFREGFATLPPKQDDKKHHLVAPKAHNITEKLYAAF